MRNFIICTHPQISLGKSRRMKWAGHVARMGEECVQGFDGKARRKETTQGVDGIMGSEWILRILAGGV
jgi:hypothetical protein